MVSQAELILRVITLCFLVLSQFFRDGMGPFKKGRFIRYSKSFIPYINATLEYDISECNQKQFVCFNKQRNVNKIEPVSHEHLCNIIN